ncbi:MAG: zinc-ribbon domain-containing protein [Thermoleophilia bacterium]|nr:zinc-ribbon domain-containing protein [Thermoleophilia bacterium]
MAERYCRQCGAPVAPDALLCRNCGADLGPVGPDQGANLEKQGNFWQRRSLLGKAGIIIGALVIIGVLIPKGGDSPPPTTTQPVVAVVATEGSTTASEATTTTTTEPTTTTESTTTTVQPTTTTTTESATQRRQAYIDSTKTIDFKVLDKNPNKYVGERLRFAGEIAQIMEEDDNTTIRLAVTETSYGYDYDDIVMIFYPGTMDAYEEDIIRVWGEGNGDYTYTSQAGWEITVPLVLAKYWEKVR